MAKLMTWHLLHGPPPKWRPSRAPCRFTRCACGGQGGQAARRLQSLLSEPSRLLQSTASPQLRAALFSHLPLADVGSGTDAARHLARHRPGDPRLLLGVRGCRPAPPAASCPPPLLLPPPAPWPTATRPPRRRCSGPRHVAGQGGERGVENPSHGVAAGEASADDHAAAGLCRPAGPARTCLTAPLTRPLGDTRRQATHEGCRTAPWSRCVVAAPHFWCRAATVLPISWPEPDMLLADRGWSTGD